MKKPLIYALAAVFGVAGLAETAPQAQAEQVKPAVRSLDQLRANERANAMNAMQSGGLQTVGRRGWRGGHGWRGGRGWGRGRHWGGRRFYGGRRWGGRRWYGGRGYYGPRYYYGGRRWKHRRWCGYRHCYRRGPRVGFGIYL